MNKAKIRDSEAWEPPERDIAATGYVGNSTDNESMFEIKIPASPTAFVRSDKGINLEDCR